MDDARYITQNRQEDVYQEISTTAALQENPQGRDEDGQEDFANVRASQSHCGCWGRVEELNGKRERGFISYTQLLAYMTSR